MIKHGVLENQPHVNGEVVFDAPWQARAFAMAVHLNEQGVFEWTDWADRFSNRIRVYEQNNRIDSSDTYYELWLDTLEIFAAENFKDSISMVKQGD